MKGKKLISSILCMCLIGTAGSTSFAATKEEVQGKKSDLQSQLNDANSKISGLKTEKSEIESAVVELDKQLTDLATSIGEVKTQMEDKQGEIDTTTAELEIAKEDEKQQYEDMKKRIQFMYENGNGAYMEMLLESESITEFLNKTEYITKISKYDRDMLVKYQDTKDTIQTMETQLQEEYASLDTLKQENEEKQASVEVVLADKNEQITKYNATISTKQVEANQYASEIAAQDEILAQIAAAEKAAAEKAAAEKAAAEKAAAEKAAAEKAAAEKKAAEKPKETAPPSSSNSGSTGGGTAAKPPVTPPVQGSGMFIWPAQGYVSSEFGGRDSPTAGASSNHKGIDIAAPYGSNVVAAAAGTVTFAGFSVSAGNYVIISHGGGISTVYMHNSVLSVSAGQSVSQGQKIAEVGSTGFSTGPHCHFGVTVNGTYVNPRNYL